jgi:hypothetical protein
MRIVLGTLELTSIGGAATYLMTVAEQLQRLGHDVHVYAEELGEMADEAASRGVQVSDGDGDLPEACEVIYAQDAPSAYALAARYPGVPQVFCLHGEVTDRMKPPQLPGVTGAAVVLHERGARHARALAHVADVVRMRQPVDTKRFAPRGEIRERPARALLLGNYTAGDRRDLVLEACREAGIECRQLGLHGNGFTRTPEKEINDSDIVIGKARVIVEAMACGRAAYVYDLAGGDGWVTPDRWALLEADSFAGLAEARPVDRARLRADLAAYRREMGPVNRDLAVMHHSAALHAEALVDLFRRLGPSEPPSRDALEEMARLTRTEWQTEARALGAEHEATLLRAHARELGARAREAERRWAEAEERARQAEERARRAEEKAAGGGRRVARLRARLARIRERGSRAR